MILVANFIRKKQNYSVLLKNVSVLSPTEANPSYSIRFYPGKHWYNRWTVVQTKERHTIVYFREGGVLLDYQLVTKLFQIMALSDQSLDQYSKNPKPLKASKSKVRPHSKCYVWVLWNSHYEKSYVIINTHTNRLSTVVFFFCVYALIFQN